MLLPIIQSLSHGGRQVPPEVASRLAIDETAIYNECDLWVDELYDFGPARQSAQADVSPYTVLYKQTFPIARVLVDVNRPGDDLENPDGAVKTATSYGQPVYLAAISADEKRALRDRYWKPFHDELDDALAQYADSVKLVLDCHNMAQVGPSAYAYAGQPRPFICLANFGDAQGNAVPGGPELTCQPALLRRAGEIASDLFTDMDMLAPQPGVRPAIVALNHPFPGGYIQRRIHQRLRELRGVETPVIMIEVNRGLFVGNQAATTPIAPIHQARVAAIRQRLTEWVVQVVDALEASDS